MTNDDYPHQHKIFNEMNEWRPRCCHLQAIRRPRYTFVVSILLKQQH